MTLEAMYCGTPVLTSDIPQFKEQVVDGQNGFTVNIENESILPDFLQDKLRISNEDYLKLQNESLNSFKDLSLTKVCNQLLKIYRY